MSLSMNSAGGIEDVVVDSMAKPSVPVIIPGNFLCIRTQERVMVSYVAQAGCYANVIFVDGTNGDGEQKLWHNPRQYVIGAKLGFFDDFSREVNILDMSECTR